MKKGSILSLRQGVSLAVIMIAVVVMSVLISVSTVIGNSAINTAKYDEYISMLGRVEDAVSQYYLSNNILPVGNEIVAIGSFEEALKQEIMSNDPSYAEDTFLVVDMNKLDLATVTKGRGTVLSKDVFIVSKNTQTVYYLNGLKYRDTTHYSTK